MGPKEKGQGKEPSLSQLKEMIKRNLFLNLHTSALKMQAVYFTETSVCTHNTTQDVVTLETIVLIIVPWRPQNFITLTD
jgi:hypothetical protein